MVPKSNSNGKNTVRNYRYFPFFLVLLGLLFSFFENLAYEAPPVLNWQNSFGGSSYDAGTKILRTVDGGVVVVGSTNSTNGDIVLNHGGNDVWVVKLDGLGAKEWQKCFGGSNSDAGVSAVQAPNGNIYVIANTSSTDKDVSGNHGLSDVWVFCLSSAGNLIWQKAFGGSSVDVAHDIIITSDGNLLIGGNSQSNNGDLTSNYGSDDFWLLKITMTGGLIWQKSFGGSAQDICYSIAQAGDGGYMASGSSNSNDVNVSGNHGGLDYWLVKTDASGNLQWQKSYGGSQNESSFGMIKNTAGQFVLAGYTNSNDGDVSDNNGSSDFWMLFVDSLGTKLNQVTLGGSNSDVAYSILQADDGGYLLIGGTFSNNYDLAKATRYGSEDYGVIKTDALGNLKWARNYGGSAIDRAQSVIQMNDGGFMITGYSYSSGGNVSGNHGSADLWLARLSCLAPFSHFTFADDTICINSLVNFTNISQNSDDYHWYADGVVFNDNVTANFQFDSVGTYEISLVSATCYQSDTMRHTFVVIDHPVPTIVASQPHLCTGESMTLNVTNYGSYVWNTGATSPSIIVSAGGVYSVTVTNHNCSGASLTIVNQYITPVITLGNDSTFCRGTIFTLNAPSGYQSYLWQDGSTIPWYDATTDGIYSVVVSNGYCSSTDSIELHTRGCTFPVAAFTASQTSICERMCIAFADLSSNATSWQWTFDGGNPLSSNDQNPLNVCYDDPGTYTVTLVVTNSDGSGTTSKTGYIIVHAYPTRPTIAVSGFLLTSSPAPYYQWFMNGFPINGATAQTYSAMQDGLYYVRISDGSDCYSYSDPEYINLNGVNITNINNGVFVYPNPSNDYFNVLSDQNLAVQRIEISDVTGKIIMQRNFTEQNNNIRIEVADFSPGIYSVHIKTNSGSVIKKMIIAH